MRVLVVEDEAKMASLLRRGLARHGNVVEIVGSGEEALARSVATSFDAIVLDIALPGIDGMAACRRMRESGVWAPVLMLTARDGVFDRVAGLDAGADDYLVKPFAFAELLARLRALHRRGVSERPTILEAAGLRLDPAARRVMRGEVEIALTSTEFTLLEALMSRAGDVLRRGDLLEYGWDMGFDGCSNVVDVYVSRLRCKIDVPFATDSIETVRGYGYRFRRGATG